MLVLTAIKKMIQDDTAANDLAVGGVHLFRAPQNGDRPNVVLGVIGGTDEWTQQGPMNFISGVIRVYQRGDTDRAAIELREAIYAVLQDGAGAEYGITIDRIFHVNQTGDYQDDAEIYRIIDDYRVKFRNA